MFAITFKHHKLRHHVTCVGYNFGVLFVGGRVRIWEPRVVEFDMVGVFKSSNVSVAVAVGDPWFIIGVAVGVAVAVGVVSRAEIRTHF